MFTVNNNKKIKGDTILRMSDKEVLDYERKRLQDIANNVTETGTLKDFHQWREMSREFRVDDDGFQFYSDYFRFGGRVGSILTIYMAPGSLTKLPAGWGVALNPQVKILDRTKEDGSTANVSVSLFNSFSVMPDNKAQKYVDEAFNTSKSSYQEASSMGQERDLTMGEQRLNDMREINTELQHDSYLQVAFRLLILADTEKQLDDVTRELILKYRSKMFDKLKLSSYVGEMKAEFENLLKGASMQRGENYYMTSSEAAGINPFITRGLEDPNGVYVGMVTGDVNSGAVLLDTQNFKDIAVVGASGLGVTGLWSNEVTLPVTSASMWGLQFMQDGLFNMNHVHQIVLNDSNLDQVGVNLREGPKPIEQVVDLDHGSLNMLEAFGDKEDELKIFSVLTSKIVLMIRLINPELTNDTIAILEEKLTDYYISEGLWKHDARNHSSDLRLIGLRHSQYPVFEMLPRYFEQESRNPNNSLEDQKVYRSLARELTNLNSAYGDVFNLRTTFDTNRVASSQVATYVLSELVARSSSVLRAQFVNALSYVMGNTVAGDTIIIHGADVLEDDPASSKLIWKWLDERLVALQKKGVKLIFLYDRPEFMFKSRTFSRADLRIIGHLNSDEFALFEKARRDDTIPEQVKENISKNDQSGVFYINREQTADSVLVKSDLTL